MKRLTIAIDFDDTIVENSYPNVGDLREGAKKYINKLYADGHYIIINTCRAGIYEYQAEYFLYLHGVNIHAINRNSPRSRMYFDPDCRKISADVYIDDKNVGGLPSWEDIYDMVTAKANGTS